MLCTEKGPTKWDIREGQGGRSRPGQLRSVRKETLTPGRGREQESLNVSSLFGGIVSLASKE